jgi:hypothetical protein
MFTDILKYSYLFEINFMTLSVAPRSFHAWMTMNCDLQSTCKTAVVVDFEVFFGNLSGWTMDNHKESICLGRDANRTPPKCKQEALLCDVTSSAIHRQA